MLGSAITGVVLGQCIVTTVGVISLCVCVCTVYYVNICIYGIWSKCLLPKVAEFRVHMGARYIVFAFGTHSRLTKETLTKQVLAPSCERCHYAAPF